MQRVLSFQMARGFNESNEFVSKRMCFSFLFSVGFLSLLCGFLLGRFATEKSIEYRAEKKRLELAGNGLESTEYLQHSLLQNVERISIDREFMKMQKTWSETENDVQKIRDLLSSLALFHKVVKYESSVLAVKRGTRESDRYVVLSVGGEGINIALELAKLLNHIHIEHNWKSRRTIVFCIFFGTSDLCPEKFPGFTRRRIVAYIAVHGNIVQERERLIVSGSDVIRSIVLQAVKTIRNMNLHNSQLSSDIYNWSYYDISSPRLTLNIPHASLSFAVNNDTHKNWVSDKEYNILLGQIVGQTLWTASESLILRWYPEYFNATVRETLDLIPAPWEIKDRIKDTITRIVYHAGIINEKIDTIESTKSLDTRILNDLLMDLDKALLCNNENFYSKTDLAVFSKLSHESSEIILAHLTDMIKCYEGAIELLQDW